MTPARAARSGGKVISKDTMMSFERITVGRVRHYVRLVRSAAAQGDDETAHTIEDHLHAHVLALAALGHPMTAELAREAIVTAGIKFSRWRG